MQTSSKHDNGAGFGGVGDAGAGGSALSSNRLLHCTVRRLREHTVQCAGNVGLAQRVPCLQLVLHQSQYRMGSGLRCSSGSALLEIPH